MFKLNVEFQGCAGCRMPESKSKELFHFTSSMTCEDLSFPDGLHGGYPPSQLEQDQPIRVTSRVMTTRNGLFNG